MTLFFFGCLFSIIGFGYFSYGRKNNGYFFISGIILFIFPYFVSSLAWLIGLGIFFVILPFLLGKLMPL